MAAQRWTHIDSIRGLAAMAVLYFHTAEYAFKRDLVSNVPEQWIFRVVVDWADLGKVAVVVFFAISGFVIPFSLLKPQQTPLRNFAISRFFRLYPAYWISIPFAVLFLFVLAGKDVSLFQVLANLTMLQAFVGQQDLLGVYWTLQIEIIFYVLCAVMFTRGLLQKPSAAAMASYFFLAASLGLAVLRFVLEKKVPVALPLSLTVMFWGLLWRYRLTAAPADAPAIARMSNWLTLAIVALIPPISLLAYNFDQGFGETWYKYTVTYYAALALFVLFTTKVKIGGRVFVYLGTISYSIYLFGPIGQDIAQRIIGVQNLPSIPIHLVFLLALAITVVIASITYAFVERPSKLMAQRLSALPPRRKAPVATSP